MPTRPAPTIQPVLTANAPVTSLDEYLAADGSKGFLVAQELTGEEILDEIQRSGLQGRGGAGFPTGRKWASVRQQPCPTTYVVCNAAEGEPGTFKDRWLLRNNPYQVLEGTVIAARAVGAREAFVALKKRFTTEQATLVRARDELAAAGLLGDVRVEIVLGPDDYLFGEEKALLEVIEGNQALPRILPPYQVGLFAGPGSSNPTVMNNAETLAHVARILSHDAESFRSLGTETSPGTMLFTVCGDVRQPGVYELPLGTPLRVLLEDVAGGPPEGRSIKAVVPGVSDALLTADELDTPLAFDAMRDAGSGLGSGGFIVYDDTACMVAATATLSRFLAVESCGQCPACPQGCQQITEALERLEAGDAGEADLKTIRSRLRSVTGGHRCGLPVGEQRLVSSVLEAFPDEVTAHLEESCPRPRELSSPFLTDLDSDGAGFVTSELATAAASTA